MKTCTRTDAHALGDCPDYTDAVDRAAVVEEMRQVHERHELGHRLGAWPNACALCEAARAITTMGNR